MWSEYFIEHFLARPSDGKFKLTILTNIKNLSLNPCYYLCTNETFLLMLLYNIWSFYMRFFYQLNIPKGYLKKIKNKRIKTNLVTYSLVQEICIIN